MSTLTDHKATHSQVYPEPTVGALIVNKEGRILLTKSHKWFDKYTLPGGHIEVGETMKEAVIREVKEEVGWEEEAFHLLRFSLQEQRPTGQAGWTRTTRVRLGVSWRGVWAGARLVHAEDVREVPTEKLTQGILLILLNRSQRASLRFDLAAFARPIRGHQ